MYLKKIEGGFDEKELEEGRKPPAVTDEGNRLMKGGKSIWQIKS